MSTMRRMRSSMAERVPGGDDRQTAATEPMPRHVKPMLATIGGLPRDEAAHTFEVKWDGVRAISYVHDGHLHMESRNLRDISARYPELESLPASLEGRAAVLDGEVVAFDEHGRPNFGRLQFRMHVA